jgi:hypothetical protein
MHAIWFPFFDITVWKWIEEHVRLRDPWLAIGRLWWSVCTQMLSISQKKTMRDIQQYLSFHGRNLVNISQILLEMHVNYGSISDIPQRRKLDGRHTSIISDRIRIRLLWRNLEIQREGHFLMVVGHSSVFWNFSSWLWVTALYNTKHRKYKTFAQNSWAKCLKASK